MPYTLIDFTRGFHSLSKELRLSAGVRSLYTALVGEFNEARWPERISFSDRELKTLAGLKSVSTVHEAKLVLKNHNLIDFTTTRGAQGRSEYQLRTEHLPNIKMGSTEHYPNNDRTITEHCSRFSVIQNPSFSNASAQNRASEAPAPCPAPCPAPSPAPSPTPLTPPTPTPTPPPPTTTTTTTNAGARESESGSEATGLIPYTPDELVEVLDYWDEELRGGRLTFEHQSELEVYLQQYGFEWVRSAMKEAADANNNPRGMSPKYLFTILKNKANPKATKGGERDEQRDEYAKPEYSDDEPWNKY